MLLSTIYRKNYNFRNGIKWKYYKNMPVAPYPLTSTNPFEFIQNYFRVAGKKSVIHSDISKYFSDKKGRVFHTISAYFLGIYLKNSIGIKRNNQIKPDFRYLWFLTCLYHDVGYLYEDEDEDEDSAPNLASDINELNDIKSKFDVRHSDNLLHEDLFVNYYKYSTDIRSKVDHGIIGGILLHDRLIKNFYQKKNEQNETRNSFEVDNLYWSVSQFKYFERAAKAIIKHNMWFSPPGDKKIYKEYYLSQLIIGGDKSKRKKLSETDPLFFLLALVDTIEPLKKFNYDINILEKIDLELQLNNSIVIKVDNLTELENENKLEWFDSIKSLEDWMQVEVISSVDKISIKIL